MSGSTAYWTSPRAASGSRLVASTRIRGQASSSPLDQQRAASARCSQLSRTTSRARSRRWPKNWSSAVAVATSRISSAVSAACGTCACSAQRQPSRTNATPSGRPAAPVRAVSIAKLVLPTPPGPVIVTNRVVCSISSTRASSDSRPRKEVDPRRQPFLDPVRRGSLGGGRGCRGRRHQVGPLLQDRLLHPRGALRSGSRRARCRRRFAGALDRPRARRPAAPPGTARA